MSSIKQSRFSPKRNNVKTFLFFLIFTSLLWLFTQFSKNYTKEIEVTIAYTNIPDDKLLNNTSDQLVRLTLNGNGFRLFRYTWSTPSLLFDITKATAITETDYLFSLHKESQLLKDKLDFAGTILSMQKDTLRAKLDRKLEKKIKLKLNTAIKYAPGYGSDKGVELSQDSVLVIGPERIVDTIQYIKTEQLDLEDLNTDYETVLSVQKNELSDILTIEPNTIEAHVIVSKFTEGSQEIPITLINIPEGKEIKIFPKVVKVVYRVGLDRYYEINQRDFKVIADYTNVSTDSSFLILELVDKPNAIHDVRLQDKQVQFIILN